MKNERRLFFTGSDLLISNSLSVHVSTLRPVCFEAFQPVLHLCIINKEPLSPFTRHINKKPKTLNLPNIRICIIDCLRCFRFLRTSGAVSTGEILTILGKIENV